jgi:hypothetical protein
MNFRKYFSEKQNERNENFLNFDGDGYGDDFNFADDFNSFAGDENFMMATGAESAPTSQPYIVVVKNTSTVSDINAVTVLGAFSAIGQAAPAYGNAAGISISMGIAGISYTEFLYQSMQKPFVVGLTYLQSGSANQVLETLTLISKDANGNVSQKTLVPTIDPYQNQNTNVVIKFNYKIDGFTSIVISSVLAGQTAKLYFYPSDVSSLSRVLNGGRAVAAYGNPGIVQGDKITLSNAAIAALKS